MCIILTYYIYIIDEIFIDLGYCWYFASMKGIRRKYNPNLSKYTTNKKILKDLTLQITPLYLWPVFINLVLEISFFFSFTLLLLLPFRITKLKQVEEKIYNLIINIHTSMANILLVLHWPARVLTFYFPGP